MVETTPCCVILRPQKFPSKLLRSDYKKATKYLWEKMFRWFHMLVVVDRFRLWKVNGNWGMSWPELPILNTSRYDPKLNENTKHRYIMHKIPQPETLENPANHRPHSSPEPLELALVAWIQKLCSLPQFEIPTALSPQPSEPPPPCKATIHKLPKTKPWGLVANMKANNQDQQKPEETRGHHQTRNPPSRHSL